MGGFGVPAARRLQRLLTEVVTASLGRREEVPGFNGPSFVMVLQLTVLPVVQLAPVLIDSDSLSPTETIRQKGFQAKQPRSR